MRFLAWVLLGAVFGFSACDISATSADDLVLSSKNQAEDKDSEPERVIYPPIRHYVVADRGETLKISIDPQQYLSEHFGLDWKKSLDLRARTNEASKVTEQQLRERYASTQHDKVMPCVEDKIIKHKFGRVNKLTGANILSDYLILAPQDVPKDPVEKFGEGVMMFVYDFDDPSSPVRDITRGLGVTCLPFRLRGSSQEVTRYFGKEALQNFWRKSAEKKRGKSRE